MAVTAKKRIEAGNLNLKDQVVAINRVKDSWWKDSGPLKRQIETGLEGQPIQAWLVLGMSGDKDTLPHRYEIPQQQQTAHPLYAKQPARHRVVCGRLGAKEARGLRRDRPIQNELQRVRIGRRLHLDHAEWHRRKSDSQGGAEYNNAPTQCYGALQIF